VPAFVDDLWKDEKKSRSFAKPTMLQDELRWA
jgi:hypothetical protein